MWRRGGGRGAGVGVRGRGSTIGSSVTVIGIVIETRLIAIVIVIGSLRDVGVPRSMTRVKARRSAERKRWGRMTSGSARRRPHLARARGIEESDNVCLTLMPIAVRSGS